MKTKVISGRLDEAILLGVCQTAERLGLEPKGYWDAIRKVIHVVLTQLGSPYKIPKELSDSEIRLLEYYSAKRFDKVSPESIAMAEKKLKELLDE